MGNLTNGAPLTAAVGAVEQLGGGWELGGGDAPMAQAIGDLNGETRAPLRIDEFGSGRPGGAAFGAAAGADAMPVNNADTAPRNGAAAAAGANVQPAALPAAPLDAAPATPPTPAPAGPQAAAADAALNTVAQRPITLSEQLRIASLQGHAELEALAEALT